VRGPRARFAFLFVSLALFGLSLGFDAVRYERVTHDGLLMLLLGWMGVLALQVGWWANPLLLVGHGLLAFARGPRGARAAVVVLSIAVVLAVSSFVTLRTQDMIGRNEGELAGDFERFEPAIFLWVGSILVAQAGAVFRARQLRAAAAA